MVLCPLPQITQISADLMSEQVSDLFQDSLKSSGADSSAKRKRCRNNLQIAWLASRWHVAGGDGSLHRIAFFKSALKFLQPFFIA